jgi:hypothetical protein
MDTATFKSEVCDLDIQYLMNNNPIEPCFRPSVHRRTNLLIPASGRSRSGGAMGWE